MTKLDEHTELTRILEQYSQHLNVVYSEAYIKDHSRSSNWEKTIEDLTNIRELTHGQCMARYLKQHQINYEKSYPRRIL
ncbi:MAG: hypothetical protein EOO88_41755 [Pedobacter sp.]|nr:MAG: hypothetical protein EOO88_41755 [Pedobacter sp.]